MPKAAPKKRRTRLGSTSRILTGLFRHTVGAEKLPANDPTLIMAVALDVRTAPITRKMAEGDRLNEANAAITAAITEIKSNPTTKQLGPSFEAEQATLAEKIPELIQTRTGLSSEIKNLTREEQEVVMQLLHERAEGTRSPEEARNAIAQLEQKRQELSTKIEVYQKNKTQLQSNLDHLHEATYAAAAKKEAIPMPAREAEKAQTAGR